jgi:4-amino-4-deoxy-L-arabinose transferase-like glycosyltransferase
MLNWPAVKGNAGRKTHQVAGGADCDAGRHARYFALAILLTAAFLRFYALGTVPRGIQVDEAMNGSNILQILETGRFQVFYPENMGREGFFINLQAIASYFLGNEPWVLRTVSALFGVLTVWTTYLLLRALLTVRIALFASFFVATSYWHLMLSRMGTRAITAPFFLTLALYLLLSGFERVRRGEPFLGRMIAAGAVYGLGFHTYTAFRVSPLIAGGVLLYFFLSARKEACVPSFWKACGAFAATATVVVWPLLVYFIQNPAAAAGRASQVLVFSRSANPWMEILGNIWKTALMFFVSGDHNWRHNYAARSEVFWPVAILFAVGIGIAVMSVWKGTTVFAYALLLGWVAVGAIPAVLSGEGVPHALRSVLMIPAVFALAGVGAEAFYRRLSGMIPKAEVRSLVLALFLLFVAYDPYHTYFDLWANSPEVPGHYSKSLVELAERFNQTPSNAPRYLAVTSTGPSANGIPVLLMPFTYLTRSYTQKQQEETNIRYITPQNFRLPPGTNVAGKTFCQVVRDAMPGAPLTCLNLSY